MPKPGTAIYRNIEGVGTRADAFLIRQKISKTAFDKHSEVLRSFMPAGCKNYVHIEQEIWCKELRLVTCMFLNIFIDLSKLDSEASYNHVQEIVSTVQRCVYLTTGALNKFLMDEKGSVLLLVWGLPPNSSTDDAVNCICSGFQLQREMKKLKLRCAMGVSTGTCSSAICGSQGKKILFYIF